jgi:hypothetical protein
MALAIVAVLSLLSAGSGTRVYAAGVLPLFENDHVKAVEYIITPKEKANITAGPPYVLFAVAPFTAILNGPDRTVWNALSEEVRWFDRAVGTFENTGAQSARVIAVEIRKPRSNGHFTVAADDGTKLAPQQYNVLLENERVRVIRVRVKPGEKTLMHSHPGAAFRCGLQERNRRSRFTFEDGTTREQENKGRGEARWSEVPSRHIIENIGDNDIHNLLVEIK